MRKSIIKSTLIVVVISFLAKLIAFVKSVIQASYFGASFETDAFNLAFGFVGNVLYMFTTALAVAFVPLYIQHKKQQKAKQFATVTITMLTVISLFISIGFAFAAPLIVRIIAPTYEGPMQELTAKYIRVLVFGLIFSLVANLYTNLLNAERIYGFSSLGSVINSIVLIAAILLFSDRLGVWTLVISVPLSYFIQWLILYIRGRQYANISFRYGFYDESIKSLIIQATPILISQATVEINQVIDRALLTSVGEGVVTAVSYSIVLYHFATTLIEAPISSVMFTELSEAGSEKDESRISDLLNTSCKVLCIVCIPVVAVMLFAAKDIVNIVYGHGRFTAQAVNNCAIGLQMYALCLLPVSIKKIMSRAYYAVNDTRRPMVLGILEVIMNITLSLLLVRPFGIYGVVGATAIASMFFIIVMLYDFNRTHIRVFDMRKVKSYWKIAAGTVLLPGIMAAADPLIGGGSLIRFIMKSIVSFSAFILILLILREGAVYIAFDKIKRRFRAKRKRL